MARSHRRKEDASLWLHPVEDRLILRWIDVSFADSRDLVAQVELASRHIFPESTIRVDVSTLSDALNACGRIYIDGHLSAKFGFSGRRKPEQQPDESVMATVPDEPAASELFAPLPPLPSSTEGLS